MTPAAADFGQFARLLYPWWYKLQVKARKPRKSQIFKKKCAQNLHISKKSCIFAPKFESMRI